MTVPNPTEEELLLGRGPLTPLTRGLRRAIPSLPKVCPFYDSYELFSLLRLLSFPEQSLLGAFGGPARGFSW